MNRYQFAVLDSFRTVTVRARTLGAADLKAREELDRRCEREGREPPVGWTLELIDYRDDKVWRDAPMPVDYTCHCGLAVHPLRRKPGAIHIADCPYAEPKS